MMASTYRQIKRRSYECENRKMSKRFAGGLL
jgi:hypothetical protein